jgi:hypothetical protein
MQRVLVPNDRIIELRVLWWCGGSGGNFDGQRIVLDGGC